MLVGVGATLFSVSFCDRTYSRETVPAGPTAREARPMRVVCSFLGTISISRTKS